ncbi:zona pellucida protein C [Kryptolebias marmoratus]|uniref:Uncharacterized LOC108234351 n=1 Tax=Kryptolebias marmoratus TaxID=37003 RepID=A0A3Q3ANE5_KRYMA|nr:zona pellucida protein C [Kryptolebias marmoratus]
MGTLQQVLLIFLGHFVTAQSFRRLEDAMFPQDFGGFFDNNWPFPSDRSFDTLFSSWRRWSPGLHMLGEIPPITNVPRVQVFCDETKLTVVVDKKAYGLMLTGEEMQLGDGCYSNKELPNQFVFAYDLNQCGTTPVLQNGWQAFTNSLHLNLKKIPPTWWQTPPTIHISCIPKRLYAEPNHVSHMNAKRFDIQAMNPSWTTMAESNLYKRGQAINLQVSAETRPDQQLFIHSCFVSASSEPQTRPRHPVILNKGCASSLGSPYTVAQFAATNGAGGINFMLNTSNLISELYVHCNVVILDQELTSASKFCNYNVNKSSWEELNGDVEVCGCCSSKCKGPSVKNLSDDAKAVVTIGPLVIVDDDRELSPALPESKPQAFSSLPTTMMSDTPSPAEDVIVSASTLSQSMAESSPQGVVMVSQDPTTRLTLWLPGQAQAEHGNRSPFEDGLFLSQPGDEDHPEQPLSTADEKAFLNSPINEVAGPIKGKGDPLLWDMKLVTLTDDWPVSSQDDKLIAEFPRKNRLGRSENFAAQADSPLPTEIHVNLMLVEKPTQTAPDGEEPEAQTKLPADVNETALGDEFLQMDTTEPEVDVQPIIHTKLEFTKGADGSKRLSYEEEVKQKMAKRTQGKQEPRLKGLRSTFLNLLRRLNKAE